jgi:tRNA (guanine-N7-)-methyltransferase
MIHDVPPVPPEAPRRAIRSFVKRGGRITVGQQRALAELWPRYGVEPGATPLDLEALFGRRAPRTLEIGFGDGEALVALAAANPERDYLGVEVHAPGVGHCLLAASAADLRNLRLCRGDAVELLGGAFAPAALNEVLILFADPWPKKRHHKRRLIQPEFVALLATRIAPGGRLALATDWRPYGEWMLEVIGASPAFRNCAAGGGFLERALERPATKFERRGARLGHSIHELEYERVPPP